MAVASSAVTTTAVDDKTIRWQRNDDEARPKKGRPVNFAPTSD